MRTPYMVRAFLAGNTFGLESYRSKIGHGYDLVLIYFLQYLRRHTLMVFVYYRLIFGIIVIALALFRRPAG